MPPVLQYRDGKDLSCSRHTRSSTPTHSLPWGLPLGVSIRIAVKEPKRAWFEAWRYASHHWAVPHGKSPTSGVKHRYFHTSCSFSRISIYSGGTAMVTRASDM